MTDPQWAIIQGDVREVLAGMDDQSVHCVVTSPPYWGLRDYGLPPLLWGSSDECEHEWGQQELTKGPKKWNTATGQVYPNQTTTLVVSQGQFCHLCGCWRGSLGLETTPELYIEHLVGIFRQVHRVLRDDGTLWLNIAGCYANTGLKDRSKVGGLDGARIRAGRGGRDSRPRAIPEGLKPKDWVPIPWMLGMALQADGWWLRSPIIWAKGLSFCETYSGSVMPESCKDRPTTSYEHLLLLTKKARYFYDADAVRERHQEVSIKRAAWEQRRVSDNGVKSKARQGGMKANEVKLNPAGRNLRSVWVINPHGFKEAHFATFPPALVSPCIKAGTSEHGCCPECGKPWERVVSKPSPPPKDLYQNPGAMGGRGATNPGISGLGGGQQVQDWLNAHPKRSLGWRSGCTHRHDPIPCLVLDPFSGSGTTVMVALRLGRRAIGIDLSPEYTAMARKRIIADNPMFNIPGEALADGIS